MWDQHADIHLNKLLHNLKKLVSYTFSKSCSYTSVLIFTTDSVRANLIKSQASCRDRRQLKRALNVYVHTNAWLSQPSLHESRIHRVPRLTRKLSRSPFPWYSRTLGESRATRRIVVEEIVVARLAGSTGVYRKTRTSTKREGNVEIDKTFLGESGTFISQ